VIVDVQEPTACTSCKSKDIKQEEDVLDTWFSSALWPFSTMGWPEKTPTLKKFYPTSCLVTGFDIIFFWVARMIMMGMKFMGDVPFRHVYIHALVRDAEGQKMSKSRGNVIDPLVIIDKYGADAFRFTLTALAAMGRDIKLSEDRIEGYKHFVNKIWNASKLVLQYSDGIGEEQILNPPVPKEQHNKWILSRMTTVVGSVTESFDNYRFNEAAHVLYQFFWHEFCDWYLELAKPAFYGERGEEIRLETAITATHTLETALRLMHPIMPFITEEIWQRLPMKVESIMISSFPKTRPGHMDSKAEQVAGLITEAVTAIRNLKAEMEMKPSERVPVSVICRESSLAELLKAHSDDIVRLARLETFEILTEGEVPEGFSTTLVKGQEIYINRGTMIDINAERDRLTRDLEKAIAELGKVEKKISNPQFLEKAPSEVVEKNQIIRQELDIQVRKLQESMDRLDG
jgi:valyl-tRNA synthetase